MSAEPYHSEQIDIGEGHALEMSVYTQDDLPDVKPSGRGIRMELDFSGLIEKYGNDADPIAREITFRLRQKLLKYAHQSYAAEEKAHELAMPESDTTDNGKLTGLKWGLDFEKSYQPEVIKQVIEGIAGIARGFFIDFKADVEHDGGIVNALDGYMEADFAKKSETGVVYGGPRESWTKEMQEKGGASPTHIANMKMRVGLLEIIEPYAEHCAELEAYKHTLVDLVEGKINTVEKTSKNLGSVPEAHVDGVKNGIEYDLSCNVKKLDPATRHELAASLAGFVENELQKRLREPPPGGSMGR